MLKKIQDKNRKGTASLIQLDVNDDESINAAVKHIEQELGRLDILINNAGITTETYDGQWPSRDQLRAEFETNVFGSTVFSAAVLPLLKKSKTPKTTNISSGLGSITRCVATSDNDPNGVVVRVPAYGMTKSALNLLTAYQYQQLNKDGFKVWSSCPDSIVTDLAKNREAREKMSSCVSSETSAQDLLRSSRARETRRSGCFFNGTGSATSGTQHTVTKPIRYYYIDNRLSTTNDRFSGYACKNDGRLPVFRACQTTGLSGRATPLFPTARRQPRPAISLPSIPSASASSWRCYDVICIARGEARAVGLLDKAGVAGCWYPGTVKMANEEAHVAHVVR